MRTGTGFRKVNHDLVELAARRADVIVLDGLREINDLHVVFNWSAVNF